MAQSKKRGRPALRPDQRRAIWFKVRVRLDELEQLYQAAEAKGQTASEWARAVLLSAAKRQRR